MLLWLLLTGNCLRPLDENAFNSDGAHLLMVILQEKLASNLNRQ